MMRKWGIWLGVLLCLLIAAPTLAQNDDVFISLQTDTTTMQTGQFYEIDLLAENVNDLWIVDLTLTYDPTLLYVVGTDAGSPVQGGEVWASGRSTTVFNSVDEGEIRFSASFVNPADPFSGTGTLGTLTVYPLSAGEVSLQFAAVEMRSAQFEDTDAGRERVGPLQPITAQPVLLNLTLQGETVEPPEEATATPQPTATPRLVVVQPTAPGDAGPTLENITRVPDTPTPPLTEDVLDQTETTVTVPLSPLVLVGGALLVIAVIGLLIVFVVSRRR